MMIGQKNLLANIQKQIENDTFPPFSIIVGPKGSGKKTLAHNIFGFMGQGVFEVNGISIDAIRQTIADAHRLTGVQAVYLIADADGMSVPAKNALLKVTEEPPKNAYFIMTLEDANNTLDTIKSRGTIFYMENYSRKEIEEYADNYYEATETEELEIIKDLCETPGEVIMLENMGVSDFYNYVQLVVDHITNASLANALKISEKIAMKVDDTEHYDLKLFWKAFLKVCGNRMITEPEYIEWVRITSKALARLNRVKSINRQMLFDTWVFDIRDWRE